MNKHILIVDDNHDILSIVKDGLEEFNYKVTALDFTENIISDIIKYSPDVIILDFLLAGINGGEHCHQIKTNPLTLNLPVIMLSGFPRVLESLGDYGADFFIEKPFDFNQLISAITTCLTNPVAKRQAVN